LFLERALTLAEPEGYVRIFVDEGPPMEALLREAAKRDAAPNYVRQLRTAFGKAAVSAEASDLGKSDGKSPGIRPLIEPLSERELQVLQLVADGLSNREIGERLFLALNTVKGHNRKIFGKLGVQRRTEAVARARELGLL
jgi:LuxR family maltose regulon positive regulatory protein